MMSDQAFRLLVPAAFAALPEAHTLEVLGKSWVSREFPWASGASEVPPFTCVSYAWGTDLFPNPMDALHPMSSRVHRVVEEALRNPQPAALWIDAFCVPSQGSSRKACLLGLGAIYVRAAQVLVVMSAASAHALKQAEENGLLDADALSALEADEWVGRAWTYQELANGREVIFVAEGGNGCRIPAFQLLNAIGMTSQAFEKANGQGSFRIRYPMLDNLESDLGGWMYEGQLDRSAFQILSSLRQRQVSGSGEERFMAMMGAIGMPTEGAEELPHVERFMRTCESKGDFSFLYTTAARNPTAGKRWRPTGGSLDVVLPWYSWGKRQSGIAHPTHLQLDQVRTLNPGSLGEMAKQQISNSLSAWNFHSRSGGFPEAVLSCLRDMGFEGCGGFLELEEGFFFPYD